MAHFSYSLLLSLMHSLWQAALMLSLYLVAGPLLKRNNPLYKRNILFILLATQFFLTVSTFFIYYTGTAFYYLEFIDTNLSGILTGQSYLESIAPWLTGAYLFVLAFKTIQLVFSWQQCKISGKASWIKPSIDLKLFTAVKANEFGIRRKVSLWYSNTINTALTFGFLKPVVLLPVALINNLTVAETETLIIHELTHIKSNDYFLNWFLIICENLFFFNPFIKIIAAKIKLEREKNCDSWVLQFNYSALNYAETLLKTARFKTIPAPFFLAAVFKNAQLIKRIRFLTEEKNLRFHKKNYSSLAIMPVIGFFMLNICLVDLIKNKKTRSTAPEKNISIVNTRINENINSHFSTNVLPVNKIDHPAIEQPTSKTEIDRVNTETLLNFSAEQNQVIGTDESVPENIIMPAALEEPGNTREIILQEENSATGKTLTKVYQMKFDNGEWKATLMWTISETRPLSDSLPYLRDTTTRFYDRAQ